MVSLPANAQSTTPVLNNQSLELFRHSPDLPFVTYLGARRRQASVFGRKTTLIDLKLFTIRPAQRLSPSVLP